jgi:hypothetical protein
MDMAQSLVWAEILLVQQKSLINSREGEYSHNLFSPFKERGEKLWIICYLESSNATVSELHKEKMFVCFFKMLAFPLITKLKCSRQTVPLKDMFSVAQHYFALCFSFLVMYVYKGLTLHQDLSELEGPSSDLPSVMCIMPSTSIQ